MKKLILSTLGITLLTVLIFFISFDSLKGWDAPEAKMKLKCVALSGYLGGFIVLVLVLSIFLIGDTFSSSKIKAIALSALRPAILAFFSAITAAFALPLVSLNKTLFFLDVLFPIVIIVLLINIKPIEISKKGLFLCYLSEYLIIFGAIFGFGKLIV